MSYDIANYYQSPLQSTSYRFSTRQELATAALALHLEYRGEGVKIDESNIDSRIRQYLNAERLKTYSVYMPIAPKIIDGENQAYIRPPIRYYKDTKDNPASQKIQKRITEIYDQIGIDTTMLELERQASYEGTLLARPTIDQRDGTMQIVKETPSDCTLEVVTDGYFPSKAAEVSYIIKVGENMVKHVWTHSDYITIFLDKEGKETSRVTEPHNFKETTNSLGGMPWAVLRYKSDSSTFWGPFDGGLLAITKIRSLLLADAVHRTQANLYELLIMAGFTPEQALASTKNTAAGRIITYENDKNVDGTPIPNSKDVKFISSTGIEPSKVWEIWNNILTQWLQLRGHTLTSFEAGSRNIQSYESLKLSNQTLYDMRQARRAALVKFEQDLFKRIVWENNRTAGTVQIPEDIHLEIDWQPEQYEFTSAQDKVTWYQFALSNHIMTPVDVIRAENPDFSKEAAEQVWKDKQAFNDTNIPKQKNPFTNMVDDNINPADPGVNKE